MKDLLSKDHYCYKIHKFLMTTVLTPCSIGNPHYGLYPVFTRKSLPLPSPLTLSSMIFQKSQPSINRGDSRYADFIFDFLFLRNFVIMSLTLPVPCIFESCIEIEIKLNFYIHTSLWCLKRLYEGL